ncbi:hypothetical protein PVAG01_10244 [Phlyctema vagabunda]|uniref:LAGLIDADG homing endonuclease n=1 Tax=Phlyctema vagabunda TaxID=108571 RepID=A0ABR4P5E2_9HELO
MSYIGDHQDYEFFPIELPKRTWLERIADFFCISKTSFASRKLRKINNTIRQMEEKALQKQYDYR